MSNNLCNHTSVYYIILFCLLFLAGNGKAKAQTYMLRATCWASFGVAMVGSCVALGRLQRGSGGVATGLFAWQWGILGRGSVAVGAWQRGSPGRGSVAVGAWQYCHAPTPGSMAAWAWQYCHAARRGVAVLPRPHPWQRGSLGVAVLPRCQARCGSTATPPLPRPDCHAATPRLPHCHAPDCHAATPPLPRPDCHAATPAATLRLPRCHAPTATQPQPTATLECPTATRKGPLPHHHAEACPVPHRNPPLPHRNSPNMLPLTCMYVCALALPLPAKKSKQKRISKPKCDYIH